MHSGDCGYRRHPRSTQDFWTRIAPVRGSLRERRPGVWELIVQLPPDSTRPRARQLTRTVHGTKREAQRELATLVGEVSAGRFVSTATTFGELLDRWLEHVGDQLSPTTVREYRRLSTKLLHPDLGNVPLRRLTTQRIDGYSLILASIVPRPIDGPAVRFLGARRHRVPAVQLASRYRRRASRMRSEFVRPSCCARSRSA